MSNGSVILDQGHLTIPVLMLFSDPLMGSISESLNASFLTWILSPTDNYPAHRYSSGNQQYIWSLALAYLSREVIAAMNSLASSKVRNTGGGKKRHRSFGYLYVHWRLRGIQQDR